MALETPGCPAANALPPLASRFLKVDELPWKETQVPGIDMKILMQDKENGLLTALFRWQPGTELPLHEHVEVEQTFVLEGSIVDEEGEVCAGDYVWRPRGNRHIARAPNGALVLSFFLKPNLFIDAFAGQTLE
ncbi:MAG: cupin domain-containing protein [Reyranella sp.]|jgi:anti-sigma factor ChrR (cupin superfamily)|uniref:cupin domain-containing protein n=1 Tax=Reyranella sp. TaxID=1929291 RepID=UPI001AC187C8|nr:cupin domain-containing protein [Reyranella sp.]MBN9536500.1 cupin domain-containing protein [Alphaproteobacteria bacterium]MBR2817542.1 cupin domain-containing protein [Reyranella sp.]